MTTKIYPPGDPTAFPAGTTMTLFEALAWVQSTRHTGSCQCRKCESARKPLRAVETKHRHVPRKLDCLKCTALRLIREGRI